MAPQISGLESQVKRFAAYWLPVIAWCGVIFYLSHVPNLRISPYWWDYPLRKIAHMAEYAVLARLVKRALVRTTTLSTLNIFVLSLLFVVLYAATDEYHQSFVQGRHGDIRDILIDSLGGWIGLGLRP